MQFTSYVEIIKNFIALLGVIMFVITIPVLLIKEHIKNKKHEYYTNHYDTQKDIQRKINNEQEKLNKFLQKQEKKLKKVRKL